MTLSDWFEIGDRLFPLIVFHQLRDAFGVGGRGGRPRSHGLRRLAGDFREILDMIDVNTSTVQDLFTSTNNNIFTWKPANPVEAPYALWADY